MIVWGHGALGSRSVIMMIAAHSPRHSTRTPAFPLVPRAVRCGVVWCGAVRARTIHHFLRLIVPLILEAHTNQRQHMLDAPRHDSPGTGAVNETVVEEYEEVNFATPTE